MNNAEKKEITIYNFSGIMKEQKFHRGWKVQWEEMSEIPGTNCYCDDLAAESIRKKLRESMPCRIRFIDSGNYHYMSLFLMEEISEPFELIVFDNHTDAQPPAFGGLISCGGWVYEAVERLPLLKKAYVIGPDERSCREAEALANDKIHFIERERIMEMRGRGALDHLLDEINIPSGHGMYLSIDKDILCTKDASTSWSQGDMTREELRFLLEELLSVEKTSLIGADICGEVDKDQKDTEDCEKNDDSNQMILNLLKEAGL